MGIIPLILSSLLSIILLSPIPSAASNTTFLCTSYDLGIAKEEMLRANYFAFVMLLNMFPADRIPGNITFLMPSNRALAGATIPDNSVLDFLLRHSIPSPLLFDHLRHFPSGSVIPSLEPGFLLRITNHGRRSFSLNNIRIISPNICISGKSIRCHGVDGVLLHPSSVPPPPSCTAGTPPISAAPPEALPPVPSSPPSGHDFNSTPASASHPTGPAAHHHESGSSAESSMSGIKGRLTTWIMIPTLLFYV